MSASTDQLEIVDIIIGVSQDLGSEDEAKDRIPDGATLEPGASIGSALSCYSAKASVRMDNDGLLCEGKRDEPPKKYLDIKWDNVHAHKPTLTSEGKVAFRYKYERYEKESGKDTTGKEITYEKYKSDEVQIEIGVNEGDAAAILDRFKLEQEKRPADPDATFAWSDPEYTEDAPKLFKPIDVKE